MSWRNTYFAAYRRNPILKSLTINAFSLTLSVFLLWGNKNPQTEKKKQISTVFGPENSQTFCSLFPFMFLCLLEMPIYGRTYAIPFLLRLFYIAIHQGLSTTTVEPTYHRGMRFHFKDNGKVCAGPKCCRTDDDARPWCSTKVYANGKHMKGNFQYCKPCSAWCVPPNRRCGGSCAGPKCCSQDGDAHLWCSTKVDANNFHVKGNYQYCGCEPDSSYLSLLSLSS